MARHRARQPAQNQREPWLSPALPNQLLRFHAERSGDLLDGHITQVVAWSEWEQHVAMPLMPQLQVFVLAGHNLVAAALQETSHLPSTNWRQGESFLFSHCEKCRPLRVRRARARSGQGLRRRSPNTDARARRIQGPSHNVQQTAAEGCADADCEPSWAYRDF
jgi:hypothetical protein